MPRDLQQSDRNEMIIQDAISACEIKLYYRLPTTPERVGFQKASWVRDGNKVYNNVAAARAHYGALVLSGIREGDFSFGKDAEDNAILIASDPTSPNFCANWKEKVVATAGDLLMLLGMQVFEGSFQALVKSASGTVQAEDETEAADAPFADPAGLEALPGEEQGVDILPLATSSNG